VSGLQVRWPDPQQTALLRAKTGIHGRWVPAFAGTSGSEGVEAYRGPARRSRPGGRPKFFLGKGGTPREVAHWRWRNELYDPLSSFVPELEPRHRRGFSFGRGPPRRKPQPCLESAPSPSGAGYRGRWLWARSRSGRVAGIEVRRSFLFALFRHHRGARAALLTAPAEPLLRDVVLARAAIFPALTYQGLLANGLRHTLRPCELRRRACRRYAGTCAHSYPARAVADRGG
jgi:hypothetical protein